MEVSLLGGLPASWQRPSQVPKAWILGSPVSEKGSAADEGSARRDGRLKVEEQPSEQPSAAHTGDFRERKIKTNSAHFLVLSVCLCLLRKGWCISEFISLTRPGGKEPKE